MATKRMLYKPVKANVDKKRHRRPLAQGRLVTATSQPLPSGRRVPQGNLGDDIDIQVSFSTYNRTEDPNATPRRAVPRAAKNESSFIAPAAHCLDLSDSEDQEQDHLKASDKVDRTAGGLASEPPAANVKIHHHPHVMVLDASALNGASDRTDVDCIVGYERSPATVICHSQKTGSASPRVGKGKDAVWQVQVDQVPKISADSPGQAFGSDAGTVVSHQQVLRDDVDTMVTREEGPVKKECSVPRLPLLNFEESSESSCSLFEYVPQVKSSSKTPGSVHRSPQKHKKRKGERTVPSRYLQSSLSRKAASFTKTTATKQNSTLGTSTISMGSAGRKHPKSAHQLHRSVSPRSKGQHRGHISPGSSMSSGQGKTSTPTHEGVPVMASCDASAINPELSVLSTVDASHWKVGGGGGLLVSDTSSPRRQSKKADLRVQQQRLDLTYARYLQWLFLDSRARKMLQQQEKDAMRQLHALWEAVEDKRQIKAELEQDIARLRNINTIDEQLETQQRGLEPLLSMLPSLQKDHSALAAALDTTRHQIHTQGVHIPNDEDLFLESLEQELQESEHLLARINAVTQPKSYAVQELADAAQTVETAVDAECFELYRCGELLSALQSLTTHENSLRIQAMQSIK